MTKNKSETQCPRCGRASGIPIIYGLPGADLFGLVERGEAMLGGCLIEAEAPTWHCTNSECGIEWGALFTER